MQVEELYAVGLPVEPQRRSPRIRAVAGDVTCVCETSNVTAENGAPIVAADDAEIVGRIQVICDEFETYGYRRVGAAGGSKGSSSTARRCVD